MDQIEIVIGTYENLIIGYRIEKEVEGGFTLESSFTTDSHRGALRCLSVSGQGVLASSSTDDSIRLHSLRKRREIGSLFQHDGSVNCIRFFTGGHMFSASEDGTICLWKCKNWELLRVLKGHRCHVMAVAVHPSAKLGLSVGSDRTFFTWDLTTGKLAFKRKIEQVAQDLLFTPDGNHYVLVYQRKIEVCSLEDTSVVHERDFDCRINAVCFVEENILAVGEDDGKVTIIDVMSNTQLLQEKFKGRVRSMCTLLTKTDVLLIVASTNGCIRVFKLDFTEGAEKFDTVLEYESGVRITCLTVYAPSEILKEDVNQNVIIKDKQKRKRKYLEDDENREELDGEDGGVNDEEDGDDKNDEMEEEDDNEIEDEDDDQVENEDLDDQAKDEDSEDEIKEENSDFGSSEEEIPKKQKQNKKKKKKDSNPSSKSPSANKKRKEQGIEKSAKKQKKLKSDELPSKKKSRVT